MIITDITDQWTLLTSVSLSGAACRTPAVLVGRFSSIASIKLVYKTVRINCIIDDTGLLNVSPTVSNSVSHSWLATDNRYQYKQLVERFLKIVTSSEVLSKLAFKVVSKEVLKIGGSDGQVLGLCTGDWEFRFEIMAEVTPIDLWHEIDPLLNFLRILISCL